MIIPPHNIEIEESLLSYCLMGDAVNICEQLTAGAFYKPSHQKIFRAITGMIHKNVPVDLITITSELRSVGSLEECGGSEYISFLAMSPVGINIEYLVTELKKKASLREIITKCSTAITIATEPSADCELVLDTIQRDILAINLDIDRLDTCDIKELCLSVGEEIDDRCKNPSAITGIPSGFKGIDRTLRGYQDSDFIILAARPSMGKTALMLNNVRNISKLGVPIAVFSLEMSRKQLVYRLAAQISKIDLGSLYCGYLNYDQKASINSAISKIYEAPIYIDDRSSLSVMEIGRKLRKLKKKHGVKIAFIDYLQLIASDKQPTRDREVAWISAGIKAIAKDLNIPVIALSQLNRGLENRTDKMPKLSDLRDSGTLEQDADIIMFLYRPAVYIENKYNTDGTETAEYAASRHTVFINIAKHRNGPTGITGAHWIPESTSFENSMIERN